MPGRAQKIRLGVFVVISFMALVSIIAFFTSEKYLRKEDTYYIAFQDISVSGLEVGSPVKYLGLKVGTVQEIKIDPENVSRVIVTVEVKEGTPIKADARADIASIGITGLKMLEIRGASQEAPLLKEGEFIQAGSSLSKDITGKAEVIAEKAEHVLNNLLEFTRQENLGKIAHMVETATKTIESVESILAENRPEVRETVLAARSASARLDTTIQVLHSAAQRAHNIVYSDTVAQILASTRDISLKLKEVNFEALIQELGAVVEQTSQLLTRVTNEVDRGSVDFLVGMRQLRATLQNLNRASRLIEEDPSVLIRGASIKNSPDRFLEEE